MKIGSKGFGNRYAKDGGGNHLEAITTSPLNMGLYKRYRPAGTAFCESCGSYKRASGKVRKGWKCKDCRQVKMSTQSNCGQ